VRPTSKNAAQKRKKEIERQKWQSEKAERRHQRQLEREAHAASGSEEDPDLAGIVPGPQPTAEASPAGPPSEPEKTP
jgi:hypothetical protein